MCCRKYRVDGPCLYYFDPTQTEFFINKTSSLIKQVSFDTVILGIRGEVQENVSRFFKNH